MDESTQDSIPEHLNVEAGSFSSSVNCKILCSFIIPQQMEFEGSIEKSPCDWLFGWVVSGLCQKVRGVNYFHMFLWVVMKLVTCGT